MHRQLPQPRTTGHSRSRAQALVEFALALPILLLVVYGLLEAGRLIFTYAAVATASREAVRYASSAGLRDSSNSVLTYQDCAGIRDRARNTGFLLNLQDNQILIYYDRPNATPPVTTPHQYCLPGNATDTTVTLNTNDRVMVNVRTHYTLLVPIVPFTSRDIASGLTARTFMGVIDLNAAPAP